MKKIILALSLLLTPTLANARDSKYDRQDRYENRDRRSNNTVPLIIGGIIIGAILTSKSKNSRYEEDNYYRHQEPVYCETRKVYYRNRVEEIRTCYRNDY